MTSSPRVFKTEAVIISQKEIGEADRLLSLYTPYLGKLKVVAKGVRRPKSKTGGHLELLNQSSVMITRGQNLDAIAQAQILESFLPIRSDLWRLSCGLYVAELVERFTPDHLPNPELYRLLVAVLHRLGEAKKGNVVLRYFEMRLLDLMGYRPQLRKCSRCDVALETGSGCFSAASGGLVCQKCQLSLSAAYLRPISLNAIKVLRHFQGSSLEASLRLRIDSDLATELENLLRSFMHYVLEREIKSTAWLDQLRREQGEDIPNALS